MNTKSTNPQRSGPIGALQPGAEPTVDEAGNLVTESGVIEIKHKAKPREEKK